MNPLLIPIALLLVSVLVYLLRRSATVAPLFSILITLGVAYALWAFPFLPQGQALGREVLLDPFRRLILTFTLLATSLFFLLAWRIPQGWSFFPFLLFSSGLLAIGVMINSLLLSMIFLVLGGMVLVFLIPGGVEGRTRGALGYFILLGVAGPILFASSWLVNQAALHPDDLAMARTAAIVLAMGFGVLLAALPLGFYLVGVAHDAPPLVSAYLMGIYPAPTLAVFYSLLSQNPWLGERGELWGLLFWGGALTCLGGGILSFGQRFPAGLLAYSSLADMGVILIGLGTGSQSGNAASFAHLFSHFLTIACLAASWSAIRYHWGLTTHTLPQGLNLALPWAAVGFFLGGVGLAGFPGTVGFATRWAVAIGVEGQRWGVGLAIMLSGGMVAWRYLQLMSKFWGGGENVNLWQGRLVPILVITLVFAIFFLGLHVQPLLELTREALAVDNP